MMNWLDIKNKHFAYHDQNTMILKELQKTFGEMYLEVLKTISSDKLFIITNIRIVFKMDAAEFEDLLYDIL